MTPLELGTVRSGATLAAVTLGLAAGLSVPAPAQEAAAGAERGWVGIGIRQAVHCGTAPRPEADARGGEAAPARTGCRPVVLAEAVIQDGPADDAGVEPGDTLVAVNGRALSRRSGQDELLSFTPGDPAELLLGRAGGRVSVRVVPEARPTEAGRAPVWVEAGKAPGAPSVVRPRVLASPDSEPDEPAVVSVHGAGGIEKAVFRVGEDGELYVEWKTGEGDSIRLRRLEEVAPRIREIQDSVFAVAKEHLEDVREAQRIAMERAVEAHRGKVREAREEQREIESTASGEDFVLPPPPPGGGLRLAGAEFRPLTPLLAEYFPGADHGLLVLQVVPGTPAAALGLRSGDVVISADGRRIAEASDLREALSGYPARDTLGVKWIRKGSEMSGVLRHHR